MLEFNNVAKTLQNMTLVLTQIINKVIAAKMYLMNAIKKCDAIGSLDCTSSSVS